MLLCLLCTLSLAGCEVDRDPDDYIEGKSAGEELEQSAVADDKFTVNFNKNQSLDPLIATNTNNLFVCSLVYENMVEVDNGFNVQPNVLTEWSTSDGGKTWTFTVAPGRVFHDGSNVTASDVAYSIQCAARNERFKERLSYVLSCSASGDDKVVVTLGKTNMMFPALLTIPVIEYGTAGQTIPGGSGPYEFASNMRSLVASKKYPDYEKLPVDTVYLAEYTDVEETISAFERGLLDVVMNDPSSTTNLGYGSANDVRAFNTTNMHYIGFNMTRNDVSNQALRFALNYAFDREYLESSLGGNLLQATIPISPASDLYNDQYARQFTYNLDTVQKMLAQAEIKDYDGDGYLDIKKSEEEIQPINISLVVCTTSSAKVSTARRFAEDMDSLGIKVTVNAVDWDNYRALMNAGNYDMYYAEVRLNSDFDISKLLMYGASLNYGQVADATMENLISNYLSGEDFSARKDACQSMCEYLINQAYIIPLGFEKHQFITHRGTVLQVNVCENNPAYQVAGWTISFDNVDKSLLKEK